MAETRPHSRPRPLSPHLQIWRWGPAMALSILHRVTGNGLAFVGITTLLCWLGVIATGPEAYAKFAALAVTIPGRVLFIGLTWAFFSHMASGIRHLVLDIGAGYELSANNRLAMLTPLLAIGLTIAFWAVLWLR